MASVPVAGSFGGFDTVEPGGTAAGGAADGFGPAFWGALAVANEAVELMPAMVALRPTVDRPCRACPVGSALTCVRTVLTSEPSPAGTVMPDKESGPVVDPSEETNCAICCCRL